MAVRCFEVTRLGRSNSPIAALLTSTSIAPKASAARSIRSARASGSARSQASAAALPPASVISFTVSSRVPSRSPWAPVREALTTTAAPSAAKR